MLKKNLDGQRRQLQEARDRLQAGIDRYEAATLTKSCMNFDVHCSPYFRALCQESRVQQLVAEGKAAIDEYRAFLDQMKV